jgi:uncharacterized damage-inducible protein DinB
MHVTDLERLYDYNYWANDKLFGVISRLTPEQFTQPVAGSYGSIRNTLVHVLSAEWGWLDRCGGAKRGERLKPENYPTSDTLIGEWARIEGYVREFLSGLKDEDLVRNIEFTLGDESQCLPLGDLLEHSAVHAVHHRGQVALLIRALGVTPGNFDYLVYVGEKSRSPAEA